jgi:hypothetical protein
MKQILLKKLIDEKFYVIDIFCQYDFKLWC